MPFLPEYTGSEAWNLVPKETQRMLELIEKNDVNGVMFLSGSGLGYGEITRYERGGGSAVRSYPLYDVTSSGINVLAETTEPNAKRVAVPVNVPQFGLLEIDWNADDPSITVGLFGAEMSGSGGFDEAIVTHRIQLSELQTPALTSGDPSTTLSGSRRDFYRGGKRLKKLEVLRKPAVVGKRLTENETRSTSDAEHNSSIERVNHSITNHKNAPKLMGKVDEPGKI
jgi:hypothetical protein